MSSNTEELQEQVNERLRTAYKAARASTGTEEGRKAIDFFYSVHLNSYPGFAHDVLSSRDSTLKAEYEQKERQHQEIYTWLLGLDDSFPRAEPGRLYAWRSELRGKIPKEMLYKINTPKNGEQNNE